MVQRMVVGGIVVVAAAMLLFAGITSHAQTNSGANSAQAIQELDGCKKNLETIFAAIQKFQADHKDLPNWLSDLVPNYLSDPNVLVCPVCRRTGKTELPSLADPKLPSSYLFEFCPLPMGTAAPTAPNKTRRDWKRRQMGLIGSKVPIVRCRQHGKALNLAFDGAIYESEAYWETTFADRINPAELTPERIFANEPGGGSNGQASSAKTYPPRDPKAPKQLLDLSSFYTARLSDAWHGGTENNLGAINPGIQTLAGVSFDVRGVIQLASRSGTNFPIEVKNIPVGQKCQRIHFLHSGAWGHAADENKQIASYIVHYGINQMRLEIPVVYGKDVRDWHAWSGEPPIPKEMVVAWKGENAVSKRANSSVRLFLTTWTNLAPDIEIKSLDLVSAMTNCSPFIVAISVE